MAVGITLTIAGIITGLTAVITFLGKVFTWVLSKQLLAIMIMATSAFMMVRSFMRAALARAGYNTESVSGLVLTGRGFADAEFWFHDFLSFANYFFPIDHLFTAGQAYISFLGAFIIYKTIVRHTPFIGG